MKIHTYTLKGKRESNEDEHFNIINLDNSNKDLHPINFVGVFDGHGGKLVSKYLKKKLPKYILKKTNTNIYQEKNYVVTNFFSKLYDNIQKKLKEEHPKSSKYCGSTAICGIHYLDKKNNPNLWIVNVGDSRAVLFNHKNLTVPLSNDHKPHTPEERKRIYKLGGKKYIKFDGTDWRIKDLSLSRAFGDCDTSPYVTHKPEVLKVKLNKNDKFVIFACDGLWDVMSNSEAVKYVSRYMKHNINIAKSLAEKAINKGSYDNVTVSILFF